MATSAYRGGVPVSGAPLPKLESQTGGAAVGFKCRWVVVSREQVQAAVGLETNVPGWS